MAKIKTTVKDSAGVPLEIGDTVDAYDEGHEDEDISSTGLRCVIVQFLPRDVLIQDVTGLQHRVGSPYLTWVS